MFLVLGFRGCSYFPTPAVAHKADLESCLEWVFVGHRPSGCPGKKGKKTVYWLAVLYCSIIYIDLLWSLMYYNRIISSQWLGGLSHCISSSEQVHQLLCLSSSSASHHCHLVDDTSTFPSLKSEGNHGATFDIQEILDSTSCRGYVGWSSAKLLFRGMQNVLMFFKCFHLAPFSNLWACIRRSILWSHALQMILVVFGSSREDVGRRFG